MTSVGSRSGASIPANRILLSAFRTGALPSHGGFASCYPATAPISLCFILLPIDSHRDSKQTSIKQQSRARLTGGYACDLLNSPKSVSRNNESAKPNGSDRRIHAHGVGASIVDSIDPNFEKKSTTHEIFRLAVKTAHMPGIG